MKKRLYILLFISVFFLSACSKPTGEYDIVTTTLPVYSFTSTLCRNTDLTVGQLVTENVSCLHDYSLQVKQMRMIEKAEAVIISGVGLEDFMDDALHGILNVIDSSEGVHVHSADHNHDVSNNDHGHQHDSDPHIWLAPENAKVMAKNICTELTARYPAYADSFQKNLEALNQQLDELIEYGRVQLADLTTRKLITFHDGFAYFAESFDLTILEAIEEESGSEASAKEIIHLSDLIVSNHIPAVFTEINGSDACAGILQAETGVAIYTLDMGIAGNSYFDAMYHNIDQIKEALQ